MSADEMVRLTGIFVRLGVEKVRLTGGEPTVRTRLVELIHRLNEISGLKSLHMTTNGATLSTHAQRYRDAGLDGLNVSVDSLQPERFFEITRGAKLERTLAGIRAAKAVGYPTLKLNVVVMKDVNDDELTSFVRFGMENGLHVRFIEFMPFLGNGWKRNEVFPYRLMLEEIRRTYRLVAEDNAPSEVAKEFRVEGTEATIGFVTSVTDDFCGGCNRIRLTADGRVKTCLFAEDGVSLMEKCRDGATDEEIATAIHAALDTKWAGHPSMERWIGLDKRAMVQIGG